MSAAATAEVAPPVKGGKKKLIVMAAVALVVVAVLAAATLLWLKSRAAHAAEDGDEEVTATQGKAKNDPAHPPTFLPLDIFVVNLADKETDRYAQVGITLELDSPMVADQMKAYMPAIRSAILMTLAHKTSRELLEQSGKQQLADEIMRETVRPLGIEIPLPEPVKAAPVEGARDDEAGEPVNPKPRPRRRNAPHNPVRHVHFSNFIIQ